MVSNVFLPKSDVNSLDFAVRRFSMKSFKTVNNDVIYRIVVIS